MAPSVELLTSAGEARITINSFGDIALRGATKGEVVLETTEDGASVIHCVDHPFDTTNFPILRLKADPEGQVFDEHYESVKELDIPRDCLISVKTG